MLRAAFVLLIGLVLLVPGRGEAKYIQLDGVTDIKTHFSEGCHSMLDLADVASRQGIDVFFFNDLARNSLEYGIPPLRRILKKTTDNPSILTRGAAGYLAAINSLSQKFSELLLISAVEVAPFYYWEGSGFKKNLVAHDWDKRLMILGLAGSEDYEQIPILNSNFSTNYFARFQNTALGIAILFLAAVVAVKRKYYPRVTVPLAVILFLLMLNYHPYRSSPFDQYHGSQGIKPYQEVIQYANSKNAMTFWTHLESTHGIHDIGSINLETLPHPQDLVLSRGYTGFQAITGQPETITEAGKEWDQVLTQYINGERKQPIWGYGGNNYRCEDEDGGQFGAVRTVFLVKEKSREAVLEAMRKGRMYAVQQTDRNRLSLDEFTITNPTNRQQATLGEELHSTESPEIKIKVRPIHGGPKIAQIFLIRNGKQVKKETGTLPYELNWKDTTVKKSGKTYYRVKVVAGGGHYLVSNPVFVRFAEGPHQVASLAPQQERTQPPAKPVPPEISNPVKPKTSSALPTETPSPVQVETPKIPPSSPKPAPIAVAEAAGKPATQSVNPPMAPSVEKPTVNANGKTLKVLIDGVALKKGPGVAFPEIKKANKGDRLVFVRRTTVVFNDKVWLVVKSDGRVGYVWEGLVEFE